MWAVIRITYDDLSSDSRRKLRRLGRGVCKCDRGVFERAITAPFVGMARGDRANRADSVIKTVIGGSCKSAEVRRGLSGASEVRRVPAATLRWRRSARRSELTTERSEMTYRVDNGLCRVFNKWPLL